MPKWCSKKAESEVVRWYPSRSSKRRTIHVTPKDLDRQFLCVKCPFKVQTNVRDGHCPVGCCSCRPGGASEVGQAPTTGRKPPWCSSSNHQLERYTTCSLQDSRHGRLPECSRGVLISKAMKRKRYAHGPWRGQGTMLASSHVCAAALCP